MQSKVTLKVLPSEAGRETLLHQYAADALGVHVDDVTGYNILKKSLDARSRQVWINLILNVYVNEPFTKRDVQTIIYPDVSNVPRKVIIAGAGPAGLFAALKLVEQGIQPIVLERGKDVRSRRRDLATLNKEGVIHPDSNYCFGEGGAGTYSDGKLYTRSNKRGDISRILNMFVQFGAEEKILYEAHPHIGTNKLPQIITNMRRQILESGGIFLFEKKVSDLIVHNQVITGVTTTDGDHITAEA